jgi:hypothetical protein
LPLFIPLFLFISVSLAYTANETFNYKIDTNRKINQIENKKRIKIIEIILPLIGSAKYVKFFSPEEQN